MSNKKNLDLAIQNFLQIFKMQKRGRLGKLSNKYRFVDRWINRQSNLYLHEIQNPSRRYWKFPRGALVFIEFGVNIGGELSNNHWAIVLDKNDSPYKKTITVVPLSSKKTGHSIAISETISEGPFRIIRNMIEELEKSLYFINRKYKESHPDFPVDSNYSDWDSRFSLLYDSTEVDIKSYNHLLDLNEKLICVSELQTYYEKYIYDSYAKVSNIQTISKDRILQKNKLDPIGQFKVSNETLDKIDQAILKLFTSID